MLYDNPQLASTLLAAFTLTGDQRFAHTARDVLDYLRREMTHPGGGLFSAEVVLCSMPASAGHAWPLPAHCKGYSWPPPTPLLSCSGCVLA